jgi:hypothetical protein
LLGTLLGTTQGVLDMAMRNRARADLAEAETWFADMVAVPDSVDYLAAFGRWLTLGCPGYKLSAAVDLDTFRGMLWGDALWPTAAV